MKIKANLGQREFVNGVNLMMHVPAKKLNRILKFLSKTKLPMVRKIAGENWYNVLTFCERTEGRDLIPRLKKFGCQDIIEFPATGSSLDSFTGICG